jgi:hypothetical protein
MPLLVAICRKTSRLIVFAAAMAATSGAADRAVAPDFWKQWGDGQAELASYDLVIPRYGQARTGTAVTIFVTEPFSKLKAVKVDRVPARRQDVVPAMKLNLIKDYQTGIYDYNEMTSSFLSVDSGTPWKVSFSRQEWCGQVYRQLLYGPSEARLTAHSYFDDEADETRSLAISANTLSEDVLLHWARGFAQPVLADGESRKVTLLTTAAGRPQLVPATAQRKGDTYSVTVGAAYSVAIRVENGGERRILSWETSAGEKATLIQSTRVKYWQLNTPEGVEALSKLGLRRRLPRTM